MGRKRPTRALSVLCNSMQAQKEVQYPSVVAYSFKKKQVPSSYAWKKISKHENKGLMKSLKPQRTLYISRYQTGLQCPALLQIKYYAQVPNIYIYIYTGHQIQLFLIQLTLAHNF